MIRLTKQVPQQKCICWLEDNGYNGCFYKNKYKEVQSLITIAFCIKIKIINEINRYIKEKKKEDNQILKDIYK